MTFKRLPFSYSLPLLVGLLGILLLVISPHKVEAISPSGVPMGVDYNYRLDYPDDDIPDNIMNDILADISGRDSRFGNLDRYRHMDYYVVGEKSAGTIESADFVGYWFIFLENNSTTGHTTPIRGRYSRHSDYLDYEDYTSVQHGSFVAVDLHLNYFFAVDGVDSATEGVLGYYYNADGTYSHAITVSGFLPGESVNMNIFSGSTSVISYGTLGRLYTTGYSGDASGRRYLLYTNAVNYGTEYSIPAIDSNEMPSGTGGDSDEEGFWASLLQGIIDFFMPVIDFFLNLFEIIWDLIVYIIELFIPLDGETWGAMFDQINEFLRERFPLLYLVYEYTVGIFLRIMDGMRNPVSLLTFPGNFFGSRVTIDFGAIERNLPQAWPIIINLVRALFVIGALPSILGFFGRMLFKDGGYSQEDTGGE